MLRMVHLVDPILEYLSVCASVKAAIITHGNDSSMSKCTMEDTGCSLTPVNRKKNSKIVGAQMNVS